MPQELCSELIMSADGFIDVVDLDTGDLINADRMMLEFMAQQMDVGCEFDGKMDASPRA